MQRVAQDWLVLNLTGSGTALGIVTALQFGPTLVLGLWGGMLADRYDKRRLLKFTQSGLALVALTLGLLVVFGSVRYWQVLLMAGTLGAITSVDVPTRQSFVIEMVGQEDLPNAIALNTVTFNIARIIGPAIAGVVISAAGTGWAFIANAGSSVAVLGALVLMRTSELHPWPKVSRARGQVREGFRYVRERRDLIIALVLVFVVSTFGMNFQLTTALLAKQEFHRSASGFGLLSTALAIGACAGAVVAARRVSRPTALSLVLTAAIFGSAAILAGSMPNFLWTALALPIAGLTMMTFFNACTASVQMGVEPNIRGRVMALFFMLSTGGTPIGAPILGWAAGTFGPRWAMVGGGVVSVSIAAILGAFITKLGMVRTGDLACRWSLSRARPRYRS